MYTFEQYLRLLGLLHHVILREIAMSCLFIKTSYNIGNYIELEKGERWGQTPLLLKNS